MKIMIKAFVFLSLFNALLIYMHYHESNHASAGNAGKNTYDQEIELINRHDGLYIRHHFKKMPENRLEIVWPTESKGRICYLSGSDSCSRLDEGVTAFIEGADSSQSISYVIPKEQAKEENILYKSIFATLHDANAGATVLHLTDETNSGGLWVTGLQEIGRKNLELIDFTLFSGTGPVTDLYWQKEKLPVLYSSDRLTVYDTESEERIEEIESAETVLDLIDAPHSAIIYNKNETIEANRFLITDQKDTTYNLTRLAVNHFVTSYKVPKDERFIAEVATSFLLNKEIGSDISKAAFNVIRKYFTAKELEQYTEAIRSFSGQAFNANVMDELFEEVTGYRIFFFKKNNDPANQTYPFILENPQDIIVAKSTKLKKHSIIKDGLVYYPIAEVMKNLDYEVSWNKQSLYIENASKKYRFPLNDKFYVLNERRYNIQKMPFEQIDDEFYFEESAMIRIFLFEIEKTSNVIEISPIAIQSGGTDH